MCTYTIYQVRKTPKRHFTHYKYCNIAVFLLHYSDNLEISKFKAAF